MITKGMRKKDFLFAVNISNVQTSTSQKGFLSVLDSKAQTKIPTNLEDPLNSPRNEPSLVTVALQSKQVYQQSDQSGQTPHWESLLLRMHKHDLHNRPLW